MILHRLILTFKPEVLILKPEGVEIRDLYRTNSGPSSGKKALIREVAELTRTRLQEALTALEGRVVVVGTSGFETKEDIRNLQWKEPGG
jgi:hypothetical protein